MWKQPSTSAGAYRQHSLQHGFWPLVPQVPIQVICETEIWNKPSILAVMDFDLWYLRFLFKSWQLRRGGVQFDVEQEKLWWDVGNALLDQWRTKQVWWMGVSTNTTSRPLFSPLQKGRKPQTRRRDKTWHGVTFCETCSPFQMGAKTWNIDGSPLVKNRAGVNPITMNCKMNECYSADPQKSLRWPNWVTWWLMQHIVHVQITRKSKGHCPSTYSLSLLNLLLAIMCGRSNCRCNANSITMDCKRNECYSADPQNVITLAKLGNLINAKLWSNQTKTKRPLPF